MNPSKPKRPDFILSLPIVLLLGFGMIMVSTASAPQIRDLIFNKQLVALALGLAGLIACTLISHQIFRKKPILFLGLAVVLFLLIGVLFQPAVKGAHRWYHLGSFGFQPSDLAKIVLIMFTAAVASGYRDHPRPWRARLLMLVPVYVVICGLIFVQPDYGTTFIIVSIVGVMLFVAGLPWKMVFQSGLAVFVLMIGFLFTESYRIERLRQFFDDDPHYQNKQALLAIGSGGLTGMGIGQGKQKLGYLPEPHSDFIFAHLCEETGFLGAMTLLGCFLFLLLRGVVILQRVPDPFSQLLGAGLLLLLTGQAIANLSVNLGLLPNKGLPLPFISAGGTSLLLSLTMFGILLNISRYQKPENRVIS